MSLPPPSLCTSQQNPDLSPRHTPPTVNRERETSECIFPTHTDAVTVLTVFLGPMASRRWSN